MVSLRWKRGSADAGAEVLVAVTATTMRAHRDLPAAALAALRLRAGWPRRDGAIGLWLAARPLARRTLSISAWESERHLRAFLGSPEHVAIVRRFRGRMEVRSVTWTTEAFDLGQARATARELLASR